MGAKINDQANTNNRGKQGDAWCIDPMKSLIFKVTFLSTTFTLKNFVLGNINCVHLQLRPLEAAKVSVVALQILQRKGRCCQKCCCFL